MNKAQHLLGVDARFLHRGPYEVLERFLVFDTETTGLPATRRKGLSLFDPARYPPYTDSKQHDRSRLVSVCWLIFDDNKADPVRERSFLVKPDGFDIPSVATSIHHITTEKAHAEGVPVEEVLQQLYQDVTEGDGVQRLIAHNQLFDQYVLQGEMARYQKMDLLDVWNQIPTFCTMQHGMDQFNFGSTGWGPKPPKLTELFQKLFGCLPPTVHDATYDAYTCALCYRGLLHEMSPHTHSTETL